MSQRTTISLILFGLFVAGVYGVARLEAQRDEIESVAQPQEETEPKYAGLSQAERREMRRRVENTVREIGTIESASSVTVFSPVPGTTMILSVRNEGELVKKGDVVAELDGSAIHEKLKVQEILVANAEAAMKQSKNALTSQTRQQAVAAAAAKKAVEVAKLAQKKWQHEYELQVETINGEIRVAQAQLKSAQTAINAGANGAVEARVKLAEAEAALKIAATKRKVVSGVEREFQAAARELEVLRRESELLQIAQHNEAQITATTAAMRGAASELKLALQRRERLQRELANCKLRAPRDGTLVYANRRSRRTEPIPIEPGATIRERQPIVDVVDFNRLQVRVPVHESRIIGVRAGMAVTLQFDALPDDLVRGTVRSVAKIPEKGEWPNTDMLLFTVIVSIEKPNKRMKIGMTGVAEIDVSKAGR